MTGHRWARSPWARARLRDAGVLLLFAVAVPLQPAPGQTTYVVEPGASHVTVHVGKTGLFSFAGHTHEVAAPVAQGTVTVVPDDLSRSTVRVTFDAAALKVTGRGEPAEDVPEVQQTMEGARVLDVSRFPQIAFMSRRVEVLGRAGTQVHLHVAGDLTLHGATRPEVVDVTAALTPAGLTARGTVRLKQTDFGIQPVTAGAGTVRVKDEVEVEFTLAAEPRRPAKVQAERGLVLEFTQG